MEILEVKTIADLRDALKLVYQIFPALDMPEGHYGHGFWNEQFARAPQLLLYARADGRVCGAALSYLDHGGVTLGPTCVAHDFRGQGVGRALLTGVESRARDSGAPAVTLGAAREAEGFYERMGYAGRLLVQSEKVPLGELLAFGEKRGFHILASGMYQDSISQVLLSVSGGRTEEDAYMNAFENVGAQMIYRKALV